MAPYRSVPIDTAVVDRFRHSGLDDGGNALRRVMVSALTGFPCRHCLQLGRPGDTMLLGSYHPSRPRGIYWSPSPVFLHAAGCDRFAAEGELPPVVRASALVSVRAYDDADQCLYDLGEVCPGTVADPPLRRALDDPRTAFVNVHTARPGCLLVRVERLPARARAD